MAKSSNDDGRASQEDLDRLTGAQEHLTWEDLDFEDQLAWILRNPAYAEWLQRQALDTLMRFRIIPWEWAKIKAVYKEYHGNPWDLEKAVDALRVAERVDAPASAPYSLSPQATPVIVTMSEVEAEPITWLWWPYLALKKLAMLDGDPGIGKSLLMTQLAASLSRNHPLPDQEGKPTIPTGGPHTTLLLSTEDGLADTLKPRLDAADADCSKIHVLTGWLGPEEEFHAFTLQHIGVLADAIQRMQPRLVVIDPIQAYLGPIDMHRANETRPLLQALTSLAEKYQCAIVCIRHPSKPGQGTGKAIHRGLGSIDFIGAARTGLFVEQHPTDPGKVLLAQSKSNIGPLGRTQMFTKHEGNFTWCGVSRLTAEIMAGSGRGPDPLAFLEALCWLEHRLEGGLAWPSEDILREGEDEGHKQGVLYRAKKALHVIHQKARVPDGTFTWRLPPFPLHTPPYTTTRTSPSSTTSTTSTTSNYPPPQEPQKPDDQDPRIESHLGEVSEVSEVIEVSEVNGVVSKRGSQEEETEVIPRCAKCGGVDRWNDHGTLRCMACWPLAPGSEVAHV